jgi:hypothetical protein
VLDGKKFNLAAHPRKAHLLVVEPVEGKVPMAVIPR